MTNEIKVTNNDFWVKIVEMLQQNWALIESLENDKVKVFFIGDTSGIFDEMFFDSKKDAVLSLKQNGFKNFYDSKDLQEFLRPPKYPFYWRDHPNGRIYSSGRFWIKEMKK